MVRQRIKQQASISEADVLGPSTKCTVLVPNFMNIFSKGSDNQWRNLANDIGGGKRGSKIDFDFNLRSGQTQVFLFFLSFFFSFFLFFLSFFLSFFFFVFTSPKLSFRRYLYSNNGHICRFLEAR